MDATLLFQGLTAVGVFFGGIAAVAGAIISWGNRIVLHEVKEATNGNIAVIQQLATQSAQDQIALDRAAVLVPANVAAAAELVKSDARDAHDAAKS
jgi:hypothetical protein